MTAAERRERLVRILMLRGKATVRDLAEELEVSERTVLRDVDILSTSKPIFALPGRGGGICITDTYKMNKPCLQDNELAFLRKLVSQGELYQSCNLTTSDVQLLKSMIAFYSISNDKKGKKDE